MIKIKRVYEKYDVADGIRILVDRLWPRGIRRTSANVDLWFKDVAPSTELRKWFAHDPMKWREFRARYMKELKDSKKLDKLIDLVQSSGLVTLVYAAKDEKHNDAVVLKEVLERKLKSLSKKATAEKSV
ncbi:MAG: DUF488 domain-containing protein [Candidatus Micrarchaeaceae archaeon]